MSSSFAWVPARHVHAEQKNAIPSGDGVIPKNDFTAEFRSAIVTSTTSIEMIQWT
jgi:hypothetical protein